MSPCPLLILASQSPRRADLLEEAGYAFKQIDPAFDDPDTPTLGGYRDAASLAQDLAMQKAISAIKACQRQGLKGIVLASDTITIGDDEQLLGKPQDKTHAYEMIQSFLNQQHAVVTGCCLINTQNPTQRMIFSDQAFLQFGHLSSEQIQAYVDTDQWQGKSGGYNLFDRQAAGWPIAVMPGDDPTTVVGLPMELLKDKLAEFGVHPA